MKNVLVWICFVILFSSACFVRISGAGQKPLQFDEAVNWQITRDYFKKDKIFYNPEHFHGPLYFQLLSLVPNESEASLRSVSVISGILLILIPAIWLSINYGIFAAMSFTALLGFSQLEVFYSRMAIHECLFTLLSVSLLLLLFNWFKSPNWVNTASTGIISGLLVSTKETFVVTLVSAFAAGLYTFFKDNFRRHFFFALLGALISFLICTLISASFSTAWDSIIGVWFWWQKGLKDETQVQPWWYYLLFLSQVAPLYYASLISLTRPSSPVKFLVISSLVSLFLYSIYPYKTPWLMLSVIPPSFLGFSMAFAQPRYLMFISLSSLILFILPMPERILSLNDTSPEMFRLVKESELACNKTGGKCRIFIGLKYYWPLPYYFRNFNADIHYSKSIPSLPVNLFDVLLLPPEAKELKGWSREEYKITRAQTAALYTRLPI